MTAITSTRVRIAAAVLAVGLVGLFTLRSSLAAFSSTTGNANNSFSAGTVVLTDNDSGAALFNLSNLKPDDSSVGCIEVSYSGSLNGLVRIYGSVTGGTALENYLNLTVERGSGTCAAFGTSTPVWTNGTDGDLGVFMGSETNYSNGSDNWSVTGGAPTDMVPYRVTISLQDVNAAQGLTATVTFTWEAQNT